MDELFQLRCPAAMVRGQGEALAPNCLGGGLWELLS